MDPICIKYENALHLHDITLSSKDRSVTTKTKCGKFVFPPYRFEKAVPTCKKCQKTIRIYGG